MLQLRAFVFLVAAMSCGCVQLTLLDDFKDRDAAVAPSGDARADDHDAGMDDAGAAPTARAVSVDTRCTTTCALLDDGDVRCWGLNNASQLGDGTTIDRATPITVRGLHDVRQVAVSCLSVCALLGDGSVRCWGSIVFGDGQPIEQTPVLIPEVSDATQIVSSDGHSCALIADGSVRCWGNNTWGNLGDGGENASFQSVQASGLTNATRIVAGYGATYAWTKNGALYAWGSNNEGILFADPSITSMFQRTPAPVPRLSDVVELAPGYASSCALRADHTVDCWGYNHYGQLGRDTPTMLDVVPARALDLHDVASLGRGFSHMCAITTDASLQCWGSNEYGQLGDGTHANSRQPVRVLDLQNVKQSVGGTEHTCALTNEGAVYCWGDNEYGQLGDGTKTSSATPVRVSGF